MGQQQKEWTILKHPPFGNLKPEDEKWMENEWKIETHQKQTHKPVFGSFFTSFLALFFISIFWKMKSKMTSKMRTMNMLNLCQHPQHQYQPWMSIKTTIFGKSFQRGWCQDSLHQWSLDHWALRAHTESHAHTQNFHQVKYSNVQGLVNPPRVRGWGKEGKDREGPLKFVSNPWSLSGGKFEKKLNRPQACPEGNQRNLGKCLSWMSR